MKYKKKKKEGSATVLEKCFPALLSRLPHSTQNFAGPSCIIAPKLENIQCNAFLKKKMGFQGF